MDDGTAHHQVGKDDISHHEPLGQVDTLVALVVGVAAECDLLPQPVLGDVHWAGG